LIGVAGMRCPSQHTVRPATVADAPEVARLLRDFNDEYDEPTPAVETLTERLCELIVASEATVLLGGAPPVGLAVIRFRPSLYTRSLDAYLEELYVAPDRRGEGLGRALLDAALDASREIGAGWIHLGTSVDDTKARGLYESSGFTNLERQPDGPAMLFYERDL